MGFVTSDVDGKVGNGGRSRSKLILQNLIEEEVKKVVGPAPDGFLHSAPVHNEHAQSVPHTYKQQKQGRSERRVEWVPTGPLVSVASHHVKETLHIMRVREHHRWVEGTVWE